MIDRTKKLECSVIKIDGHSVGDSAYISQGGGSVAVVRNVCCMGGDEFMSSKALEDAQYLCDLHNATLEQSE